MTPREFAVYTKAYSERLEFEQEIKRREIYLSALLTSSFVWAKGRRPSYEAIFGKQEQEEMSDEQMLIMVEALNAQFGGSDSRKEAD